MLKKRWMIFGLILCILSGCAVVRWMDNKKGQMNNPYVITSYVTAEDGQRIAYDLYDRGHRQVIVIAHGYYNSKQAILFREMAELLNDEYDVILFDFRGHGKSRGTFTWTKKEYLDLETILEMARLKYERIGVIGYSLGGATSIVSASRGAPVDSLIAVSAPAEFGRIDYQFWRKDFVKTAIYNFMGEGRIGKGVRPGWPWRKKIKPIDVIDQIEVPILIVHGDSDWLIRPWHARKLYEKANQPKSLEMIRGGSHAEYLFRQDRAGIIQLYKDWFDQTLTKPAPVTKSRRYSSRLFSFLFE